MKKLIIGTFTAILTTGLLFGCGTAKDKTETKKSEETSTHKEEHKEEIDKKDEKAKE
ncbi:hypothetical protein ACQKNX_00505 [Lysinibacillus sp. NPDC093712]|uniref:hypothetical protein n=1 Tax=Lysinibacillus sp. NPDC093712 TaxID=3390579 RepID=UPI003D051523